MTPKNIKQMQARSRKLDVRRVNRNTYVVESVTSPLAHHIVTIQFGRDNTVHTRCTCAWAINGGVACSHVLAALEHLAEQKGRTLSFWLSSEDAQRQKHRTFYLAGLGRNGVWITSRRTA